MEITKCDVVSKSRKDYIHLDNPRSKYNVDKKLYNEICKKFFKELAYVFITTGDEIELPSGIGTIQVCKKKDKLNAYGGNVDVLKSKKLKKKVYHDNSLTNGYWFSVRWFKSKKGYGKRFKNSKYYKFNLTRPNIRKNTWNKNHPKVHLVDFFKEQGFEIYKDITNYYWEDPQNKELWEQLKNNDPYAKYKQQSE